MDLQDLKQRLRRFAADRDWQHFHTPKNLSMALMVEAAELAEIFQWDTPEKSRLASSDSEAKARVGAEVADVLLYLVQLADQCSIDIEQAVEAKLIVNAAKYPTRTARALQAPASTPVGPSTHVLIDYENVQPSVDEIEAATRDVSQLWVFHGPHQQKVDQAYPAYGDLAIAVPISKTGKNALDFHLSYYLGYIASRHEAARILVFANDTGYEPMLMHAREMGIDARRVPVGAQRLSVARKIVAKGAPVKKAAAKKAIASKAAAKKSAKKAASDVTSKSVVTKAVAAKTSTATPAPGVATRQAVAKKPAAKKTVAAKKQAPVKTAAAKPTPAAKVATSRTAAIKKTVDATPIEAPATSTAVAKTVPVPGKKAAGKKATSKQPAAKPAPNTTSSDPSALTPALLQHAVEGLRKMKSRPAKLAGLQGALKSLLGVAGGATGIQAALDQLRTSGVIEIDASNKVRFPLFET